MSALVARAMREPVPFDRDIPGKDRKALEILVSAGVLKKERVEGVTVFAPAVTLAEFRKPKAQAKTKRRENVETWLRKDLAKRAKIPGASAWKETAFAQGKYRMLIDGSPCYFAAHVKDWKVSNRAALCQGYDPYGLTLEPRRRYCSWQKIPNFAPTLFDFARWQRKLERNAP